MIEDKMFYKNKHVKRLIIIAEELECSVVLKENFNSDDYEWIVDDAFGFYESSKNKITLFKKTTNYPSLQINDIIYFLAHEIKHLLISRDKKEESNCWPKENIYEAFVKHIADSWKEEIDCEQYAVDFLNTYGLDSIFIGRYYPLTRVTNYRFFEDWKIINEDGYLAPKELAEPFLDIATKKFLTEDVPDQCIRIKDLTDYCRCNGRLTLMKEMIERKRKLLEYWTIFDPLKCATANLADYVFQPLE